MDKYKIINFNIEKSLHIEKYVSYTEEIRIFHIMFKTLCKNIWLVE